MKKIILSVAVLSLLFSQTSCIGSFALTKKVLEWNRGLGSKWVSELVFLVFVIVPVYPVATFIDAVILNLIEFWSGSNPMAMKEGDMFEKFVQGKDGNTYHLIATRNKMEIQCVTDASKTAEFNFNENNDTWSLTANNQTVDLCTLHKNSEGNYDYALVYRPDGSSFNIAANEVTKEMFMSRMQSTNTEVFVLN